ncbi:response regulator [Calothrix sp. PCC 7507]|uniref:response regulator n=1 Tax=Calothrix sp. PCC 7507 TaxID=99598 RepID=UPI00029EC676|nr:response regulator [Calothrix sp. PCC 7507]AFY34811.1 response regulator receiver [Calothrix sp. PCC 7507]
MNSTIAAAFKVDLLKGVQILVVDNDVDSGVLYAIFLKYFGANVMTAGSIKEAVEIMSWFVPHIMICEIRFLGESVYTLLKTLSAMEADNRNHIPIIVTSTCPTSSINEIPEIEVEKYLIKPVDLDKLIFTINNLALANKNMAIARPLTKLNCVYSSPF